MAMYHEIENLLRAPLEDVLLKLFSATALKWLYDSGLRALAEAHPDTLPQPEPPKRLGAEKVPKKAYLISLLLAVLRDPALSRQFFDSLPRATRDVLAVLTWEPSVNLDELEKRLGLRIAEANPDNRRVYYEPFLLPPEHSLLVIRKNSDKYYWSYSSQQAKPKKEDYHVVLPDAIRRAFKPLVPPPAGFDLQALETLPATKHTIIYSCAQKAIADLRLVAEYIAQGHLKYTKSERIAMPSVRALHQMTGGPEFFEGADDPDLALLRTRLLSGGVAFSGEKEREKLLAHPDSPEPVRHLVEKVLVNASFLHEELLGHLPPNRNRWCQYSASSVKALPAFFGKLPSSGWIAWENMRSYHVLREELPTLFAPRSYGLEAHATEGKDMWSTTISVNEHNSLELVNAPLLKGYAFLLAALGLAEIAYLLPKHSTYHRPKQAYLSPYDGLGFVRLTSLGEFVFRRRETYEVPTGSLARPAIMLDETRLLATCRNPDPLTKLTLDQFFEELAPSRYQMTPESLLGRCKSREDLEERIRLFRRVVSAAPPAIWEGFFERTLARIAPLTMEMDYVVLKVSGDEEIRRLLASDPILRETVLKVEGLRIAVRQTDLKKLAKRLEQFGYLIPLPRLA